MRAIASAAAGLVLFVARSAAANEADAYGLGSRSSALAGAVLADTTDFSAVYYNPAAVMNENNGLALIAPRITPVLDPWFRPAVLANHAFVSQARAIGRPGIVKLGLEQADGSVFPFSTEIFPESSEWTAANLQYRA